MKAMAAVAVRDEATKSRRDSGVFMMRGIRFWVS
jgi:hypothetical protein